MPSPPRALPLRHRSYGLMCHSRWALFCFGIQPRLKSLGRLCAVPAAPGSFPTLSLRIFPWMLDPVPRRYTVCSHLFLPRCHRPSPSKEWVGFPHFVPRITTSRGPGVSRMQIFLDVPASKFALPPDRSYRCAYCCRAAGDFTSGPIVLCCLHTHRIC